jgi:hypothetical protein
MAETVRSELPNLWCSTNEPRACRHLYQICPQTKGRFKRQPCYARSSTDVSERGGQVTSASGTKGNSLGARSTSVAEGRPALRSTRLRQPPLTQSCRSVATDQTAQKGGTAPCAAACRMTTKPVIAATVIAPWGRPSAGARSMAGDDAPLGDCLIPCLEISAGCTAVTRTCTVRASQKKRTLMICRALD